MPLLKTVYIVSPLSGNNLAVFHHYGDNHPSTFEYPGTLEFLEAVRTAHPPPDHKHEWTIFDPETGAELEPAMDIREPYDKVYAVLQEIDSDKRAKKRAQWGEDMRIRAEKSWPWPDYETIRR